MRDLLLAALLFGGLPVALARPFYGAMIFTWLGLMNPHRFTFGIAYDMPWSMLYAVATIAGIVLTGEAKILDSLRRYWPAALYVAWMAITTQLAAVGPEASYRFEQVLKVHVMCLLTLALLTTRRRTIYFAALVISSVAFFGVKGGVFTLVGGGADLVWGPPETAITDNNHLAAGLIMTMPMLFWAYTVVKRRWLKLALIGAPMLVAFSVFGSHSRGAFLGLMAMGAFLILKGKHKLASLAVAVVVGLVAFSIMPQSYWSRIDSIGTYEEDASATGRINTWWTAFNIANSRPTGAGFEYYGSWLYKAHAPNPNFVHSSHSIYFQALGEHGWIGLSLYLIFLWVYWRNCGRLIKLTRAALDEAHGRDDETLARMLQVSIIGFMVAGAFVNIGNWDAVFYFFTISLALNRIYSQKATKAAVPALPKLSPYSGNTIGARAVSLKVAATGD